ATAAEPHAPKPPATPELPAVAHLRAPIEPLPNLQPLSAPWGDAARPGASTGPVDVGLASALPASEVAGDQPTAALPLHATQPESIALSDRSAAAPQAVTMPADWPMIETRIDTAFGGLFYLLNLALALELYGDFTMPAHTGIALPVWDFLA